MKAPTFIAPLLMILVLPCAFAIAQSANSDSGTVDQATINAAMEKLRAKQAAGESPTEEIARLQAENAILKETVSQLEKASEANSTDKENLGRLILDDVPLTPVPDSAADLNQAWHNLMDVSVSAALQCQIQSQKISSNTNNESQMLASIAEFKRLRQLLCAPTTPDGRKVAESLASALDSAYTGIGMLNEGTKTIPLLRANPQRLVRDLAWPDVLNLEKFVKLNFVGRFQYEAANDLIGTITEKLCADQNTSYEAEVASRLKKIADEQPPHE